MIVIAQQNDTVDALCWRHLGTTQGVVEQAYELNRNLADQGPFLKHGTQVILPEPKSETKVRKTVKLWD
ncbi:MAG: phage tail protein [Alcaligenaceae bacterium]|nr:phage tail protein [Alcaligenaceae bacterium]